ncbi:hypothetical protein BQ8794_40031 [Mesorhizobium prunaredense]|uniref:Uncharacterized protein n=1 Tax=Mesorhizobium prunaredense TaxID=1631249 RepID=A0A1R3VC26_9HYPH|nr:hypothetical protein BQ8794_40031 [Mesorhizobium prunaredense]
MGRELGAMINAKMLQRKRNQVGAIKPI